MLGKSRARNPNSVKKKKVYFLKKQIAGKPRFTKGFVKRGKKICLPEMVELTDDQLPQRILKNENEYRKSQQFCDFKVISNGCEIPVHKLVLASSSSYFNGLFSSNLIENNNGAVNLDEFPTDVIVLLIEYMYTGKLQFSKDSVKNVFEASKYLGIDEAANLCVDSLMESVSTHNALDMWTYADKFSQEGLLKKVKDVIAQNAACVFQMPYFKDCTFDQIHELISNDELNISEEEIFTYVIGWIKADFTNRSQYLLKLIEDIRIPIMKSDFVKQNIVNNELILAEPACMRYIIKSLNTFLGRNYTPTELILSPRTRYRNGFTKKQTIHLNSLSGSLIRFDHANNEWQPLLPETKINAEKGFACANYRNNFFLAGTERNSCVYFNPVFNTWQNFYPMKQNRKFHGLICVDESLYACGGLNYNTIELFDVGQQGWIDGPSMVKPRAYFGLVTIDKSMYAVGGSYSKDIEHLDPRVGTWSLLSDLPQDVDLAIAIDKSIYGFKEKRVGMFDIRNKKWEPFSSPDYNGFIRSVAEINGNIFVFIDYRSLYQQNERRQVYEYNTTSKKWTELYNALTDWGTCLGSVVLNWQK